MSENTVQLTCILCNRPYRATVGYEVKVKAGQVASICGYCDGSHDDGEERQEDAINRAEYQHADR